MTSSSRRISRTGSGTSNVDAAGPPACKRHGKGIRGQVLPLKIKFETTYQRGDVDHHADDLHDHDDNGVAQASAGID